MLKGKLKELILIEFTWHNHLFHIESFIRSWSDGQKHINRNGYACMNLDSVKRWSSLRPIGSWSWNSNSKVFKRLKKNLQSVLLQKILENLRIFRFVPLLLTSFGTIGTIQVVHADALVVLWKKKQIWIIHGNHNHRRSCALAITTSKEWELRISTNSDGGAFRALNYRYRFQSTPPPTEKGEALFESMGGENAAIVNAIFFERVPPTLGLGETSVPR